MRPATADLEALLRELVAANVEFIVVGGAAAVIHGAPITTQDLDIVPRQDAGGLERLLAALTALDTRFRPVRLDRDLAPTAEHLAGGGQLNLITRHGPLDVLLRLHDARGYDELIGMFNRTGRFNPEALAVLSRSFVEMGMLAQEPDIKTLITEEFLPGSR